MRTRFVTAGQEPGVRDVARVSQISPSPFPRSARVHPISIRVSPDAEHRHSGPLLASDPVGYALPCAGHRSPIAGQASTFSIKA